MAQDNNPNAPEGSSLGSTVREAALVRAKEIAQQMADNDTGGNYNNSSSTTQGNTTADTTTDTSSNMAGKLTIQQNTDGTATINFEDGGSHTVGRAGDNVADNVAALQGAYGDRIGNVVSSELTGATQISNANAAAGADSGISNLGTSNAIPDWVDPAYSYDPNNPRKPNSAELTAALAGIKPSENPDYRNDPAFQAVVTQNTANSLLYGIVGSNTDTRNWNAIMEAGKVSTGSPIMDTFEFKYDGDRIIAAASIATNEMYGGINLQYGSAGKDQNGTPFAPTLNIVGGNGVLLRTITKGTAPTVIEKLMFGFGVKSEQITNLKTTMGENLFNEFNLGNYEFGTSLDLNSFDNIYKYNFDNTNFTTGVSKPVEKTISGTSTGTETTQVKDNQQQQQQQSQTIDNTSNVVTADMTQQNLPQTVSYQLPQGYTGSGYLPNTMGTTQGLPSITPMTGTFTKPAGTGMMTNTTGQQYTVGSTTPQQQQTTITPQYDVRMYRNNAGMTTSITFVGGKPQTPIPSGFYPVGQQPANQTPFTPQVNTTPAPTVTPVTGFTPQFNMAQGGIVPELPKPSGKKFGGFKPEAQERIAQSLGYTGEMKEFDKFLEENPEKKEEMDKYTEIAKQMAEGGAVLKAQSGVDVTGAVNSGNATTVSLQQYDPRALNQQFIPQQPDFSGQDIQQVQASLAKTPKLPTGATVVPVGTQLEAGQIVSPYSGQVSGSLALPTGLASTEQAYLPTQTPTTMMSPIEASGAISATANQTQAAQLSQIAQINAAQNVGTSVSNVEAAQGTGILMSNPVQRQIQDGELISGVANAETAAKFNEEIQAATATPTKQATVQGQLEGLMAQFEGGNTPAWAAGSMRAATATMAARGLGASSLAGQAIIQAAMEAALPIAQMDAQVTAQFEQQNLSNRQQRAILAAQQRAQFLGQEFDQSFQARVANSARIGDIANQNFTAEQQVALENSRIANTMNLSNLSNSQARVMAEAAALANMDMSNLNNRQQAAVQNAQNFLQADLTNLNNKQSTELFKAQQRVQSLFTDQAALNAAQQFNATSQNQTDQFFSQMQNQTAQFNASQANAQAQFNAGQVNVIERFNAEINNQRDQFNATNRLVVDQANAQWRRQIATADTASVNRANEINAQSLLGYSQQAYNNLWQFYKDNMHWAWTSADNERDRYARIGIAQIQADSDKAIAEFEADAQFSSGFGSLIGKVLTTDLTKTALGGLFGIG